MSSLQDRVVVVTGASSGIGRTIALRCAHEGAQVLASGRLEEALQELAAGAPAGGIRVHRADLTEPGAPEAATDAALSGPGRLDGVVHAAGTARRGEDIRSARRRHDRRRPLPSSPRARPGRPGGVAALGRQRMDDGPGAHRRRRLHRAVRAPGLTSYTL